MAPNASEYAAHYMCDADLPPAKPMTIDFSKAHMRSYLAVIPDDLKAHLTLVYPNLNMRYQANLTDDDKLGYDVEYWAYSYYKHGVTMGIGFFEYLQMISKAMHNISAFEMPYKSGDFLNMLPDRSAILVEVSIDEDANVLMHRGVTFNGDKDRTSFLVPNA
ncbi:hypothetical protein STAS_07040 [Striga asiatica]|uniref:Uncharacterized protein n=1 Tax=Striga asiatica TaxID=4170 RepID=A0A5A7PE58_STRAF|nr:hypothetical protein STAS_07040 [Striga asiatica]